MSLSALCLECGLCCDGTLFRHVAISVSEREQLVQLGIGVGQKQKHGVMWLPCGKLEGKCCSIYESRPGGCRRFVCALGKRLVAGELSLPQAQEQLEQMQARLAALQALLPPPPGEPLLRHARSCIDSSNRQVSDEQLEAFKRVEELRYSVFMPPPE
jgi:Fe-S-cluster containining protein